MRFYRVSHQVSDLGWVGLTLILMFHSSCPAAQPVLPILHQSRENWADCGISKIKVNLTQVRDLMVHPVDMLTLLAWRENHLRIETVERVSRAAFIEAGDRLTQRGNPGGAVRRDGRGGDRVGKQRSGERHGDVAVGPPAVAADADAARVTGAVGELFVVGVEKSARNVLLSLV